MSEAQRGRPKKHLEAEHHFTAQSEPVEAVVENPTLSISAQETESMIVDQENGSAGFLMADSPIEQKIHQMTEAEEFRMLQAKALVNASLAFEDVIDENGWHPIETFPKGGLPIYVNNLSAGDGVLALWKRTRAFNGKVWAETGKWVDYHTGEELSFKPRFWRGRF